MIAQRLSARRLQELLGAWRGDGHSYRELSESIGILVRDGRLPPASVLPAERPLAEQLGVSRTTVAAAYQRLREDRVVESRRGSGTVVLGPRATGGDRRPLGADEEISLTRASPGPWSGLPELGRRALAEHADAFLLDGFDTIGHPALREIIAQRYTDRGLPTRPDQIMVTLGAQHAIFLIARTLLRRGDRSLIESPSYPHAREALAAAGALVAELPVGVRGHDAASMLEITRRSAARLAYLIPDHHNPTGLSMPPELREHLIANLADQGAHLVVDETTAELVLGAPRPVLPFAASAARPHHHDAILTVGSLGKTVWGGLRVGWIRAAPDLIARLEAARVVGDLGTGTWAQVLGALALERYDEVLADRARELTAGHRALLAALERRLPEWSFSPATGGVSVWADLGEPRSTRLGREAARLGLRIPPGPQFGSPGVFERFVRLPFAAAGVDLTRAVEVLSRAWRGGRGSATPAPVRAELV
ncbi:MocR-like transcription factor YczR [Leucobacter tenebrionis]|uniref:MocR-like transcription factor YczR n=1 Tax=Leucobacter tenebrionis TaxID=2873270 RepID=UPI001CA73F49|nr:PLP-dependent aminotransferase family protein [Leucobacter tenebrionis]QZY52641.1 PLP-dependent aminotransferase family protein [Leucobacter tenebrionis]